MTQASARHILVSNEKSCIELQTKINAGELSFEEAAATHSQCPSGKQGGDLGSFGPGMMVSEFDHVVFNEEVGKVHGPVQTQFGFHLVEITSRQD
ncbi:MAG: peptidylprolyl isomerase [Thalassotalea sp.]|nr:peptidylprolyl isomerase [Thalassotalea sp.]MCH2191713.1 peptidylprolyl isomerase [Gammaproteobacteria bacterium]